MSILSPQHIAAYRQDGILLPPKPLLPAADFAALQADFERLLQDWTQRFGRRPEEMDKPHFLYPELFRYATHPAVLDLVEQLIGPDIVLFTTHFICKPPGTGQRVPWHEDSGYWANMLTPMEDVLTVWLALDPSVPENGCVRFVPGSHREQKGAAYVEVSDRERSVFAQELNQTVSARAEREAIDAVLQPGFCSIHHAKTIHGSRANHSQMRRCGFTMRYFSAACRFHYQDEQDPLFQIYLVRGQDRAGNRYGRIGEVNTAWRDRLLAPTA